MSDIMRDEAGQMAEPVSNISKNDRFSAILVVVTVLAAIATGLALRQRAASQTWLYESREAGIQVLYPAEWLVDERGDYVVRIRDPRSRPFKTQYQIAISPAGGQTSIRNVLDSLTVQRSTNLAAYRVLSVQDVAARGTTLTQMSFAFVDADPNPFIQRLPVVVQGVDIVIRDGDRVIIVTYMADENTFANGLPGFEQFLTSLQY